MSDDEDANVSHPAESDPARSKYRVPEGLHLQELIAEVYKSKMNRLKRGGTSGITGDFPSAASLFFEDSEVPPPARIDFNHLEPGNEEVLPRIAYLAHTVRVLSRDILNFYLDECQAGRFGAEIAALPDPADEVFSTVVKELACVNLYLCGLEQVDGTSPSWIGEYLEASISFLDNLVIGPPSQELKPKTRNYSVSDACREFTADLCRELNFGALGEPCWNFIYFKVKGAGQKRADALLEALTRDINDIAAILKQL